MLISQYYGRWWKIKKSKNQKEFLKIYIIIICFVHVKTDPRLWYYIICKNVILHGVGGAIIWVMAEPYITLHIKKGLITIPESA